MALGPGNGRIDELGPIYDRLATSLFRYALILLADHHEAEDVIQHVFATLLRRGERAGIHEPDRYLRAAVRNECFSRLGRRRRTPETSGNGALLEAVAGVSDRPDDRIAIEQGLRTLPPEQREVVHLKVFEGRSFQEIAELAGESINTVASRYRYAIDKLKVTFGVGRSS